jgi:hypothetical protein
LQATTTKNLVGGVPNGNDRKKKEAVSLAALILRITFVAEGGAAFDVILGLADEGGEMVLVIGVAV